MAVDNDKKLISLARLITFKNNILSKLLAIEQIAKEAQETANSAQTAATNASTAATEAKTAAQTAQSAVQSVSSASTPTAFSVEAAAWTALASPVVGRGYSAEIAAEGVTAGDFPDVYFDAASVEAASTASILADTADGAIVLYAKSIPTTALSGAYFIRKGVTG